MEPRKYSGNPNDGNNKEQNNDQPSQQPTAKNGSHTENKDHIPSPQNTYLPGPSQYGQPQPNYGMYGIPTYPPPPYYQYSNLQQSDQYDPQQAHRLSSKESVQQRYYPQQYYASNQPPYPIQQPGYHQGIYVPPYTPPPPNSARDTPMVRPGRRPNPGETQPEGWRGFQDKHIRTTFVRKVYIILMFQLLFTMGIIALFLFEPHVKRFVQKNIYLYYISLAIFVALYIGLACFQSARRKFPVNVIVLCVFTLAMSYMLGTISSFHNTEAVLMAVGICAAVCLAVTIFSFYTKIDFTSCGPLLCVLLLILILFGLIAIFVPSRIMTMIYAATGAVVFTLFLAYDTQMLMGGKKIEISPEEYVFAAVQIYIDIVYIFLFILMLTGGKE